MEKPRRFDVIVRLLFADLLRFKVESRGHSPLERSLQPQLAMLILSSEMVERFGQDFAVRVLKKLLR